MEAKSKKRGKAFGAILGLVLGYVVVDKSIDITTASAPEVAFAFAYLAGGFGGAYIGGLLARGKKKGALIFESK